MPETVERETTIEKISLPTTTVVEGEPTEPNETEPQEHDDEADQSS